MWWKPKTKKILSGTPSLLVQTLVNNNVIKLYLSYFCPQKSKFFLEKERKFSHMQFFSISANHILLQALVVIAACEDGDGLWKCLAFLSDLNLKPQRHKTFSFYSCICRDLRWREVSKIFFPKSTFLAWYSGFGVGYFFPMSSWYLNATMP